MGLWKARIERVRVFSFTDLALLVLLALGIFALVSVAQEWSGPFRPSTRIELGFGNLAWYGLLSFFRVAVAYACSLAFTIAYGYVAAKSRTLEPFLISLLDILQSIPVLGFMPGLVISLVYLFPSSNVGLELAAVIMIFTGQAWNMVFSFYSSVKSVPREWRDLTSMTGLSRWQVLRFVELPHATTGLLWNSMLSVAGGWFFLMVIESFTLGDRDFRLPGIGSYMAVAYEQGDGGAILMGIGMMFFLIILTDRFIWAPLVVWSERFRGGQNKHDEEVSRSFVLDWIRKSEVLDAIWEWQESRAKAQGRVGRLPSGGKPRPKPGWTPPPWLTKGASVLGLGTAVVAGVLWGGETLWRFVSQTQWSTWVVLLKDTGYTFLRVGTAVVLGSLWTIPVGVFIGTQPKWTRRLQPVVQIVASFPIPMLFPMIAFFLVDAGIGLGWGSVLLLQLASQWYILFNVISGASRVPAQIMDVARVFGVRGWAYWRSIALPAIFPDLVNGWITAAGGAWNACIVAEWVQSGDRTETAPGIGSAISRAAEQGDYAVLACAILTMVVTVVLLNRVFWDRLYRLAETRFKADFT